MSNDIKPGQVWADRHRSGDRLRVDAVGADTVEYTWKGGSTYVRDTAEFLDAFEPVDATPAPIDPKLVHVGDTVTVRFIETGEEFTTKAYQPEDITAAGEWVYILGWPLNKPMGHGLAFSYFEILDHQPAPEPEREWEPGTVALVRFPGGEDDRPNLAASYAEIDGPRRGEWRSLNGDCADYATDVEIIRPLVVIDPAAVDVDHLRTVIADALQPDSDLAESGVPRKAARAVRTHLGIEVSR